MTPSRPYIMRALYEWIVDNSCTPYILVDATMEDVSVPEQYVKDGQIVLNISPTAVMDLDMSNDAVVFNGRFGGVATDVYVPVTAVVGIYARENGQGMVFEPEDPPEDDPTPPEDTPPEPSGKPEGRPSLKIVK
ncbi:ClpXP protease specificity-enhancing factor [Halioglobus japonicus]|uniref:ClpXP protease specificity-enhancing factor n=1 Tax=Halioglobus japonicus TaxID=930805 RepID=A0AAP8MGU1_9GAMM|nr:ClpXP protease specificity-enhancing factor [Halioglobus japonicus]AQA19789.1 ClpXP protease specificity-enhancing factor [Halioglobus japonicus]PLW87139.1 ClpXP protease specificity-enhancing factor [Halioglobus japonicus]GHD10018.1 stringent starvation protein B [Halioglobus japonicus]